MKTQNPLSKVEDIFENKQHSDKEVEIEADFSSHTDGKVEGEIRRELVFTQSMGGKINFQACSKANRFLLGFTLIACSVPEKENRAGSPDCLHWGGSSLSLARASLFAAFRKGKIGQSTPNACIEVFYMN